MIKLWPAADPQLTPRPGATERNPFDDLGLGRTPPSPSAGHRTPTLHHHLLNTNGSSTYHSSTNLFGPTSPPALGAVTADLTPLASPNFIPALPTTSLSLHAPDFKMQQRPPPPRNKSLLNTNNPTASQASSPSSLSTSHQSAGASSSKGQIHVKLIQARGLNVHNSNSRPYVVVQFEQNEFVSRDPTDETDKEVKGTPSTVSARNGSSSALNALGAIGSKIDLASRRGSGNSSGSSPASSVSSGKSSNGGIFGRVSAHNPVWKHEVSFDVTSEASLITFNVYDRSAVDHGFLGTVQIKPVLIHDHTVDQWYKLRPFENEAVSGDMRVQITFEQFKTKRALTPRDFEFLKLIGRGTFGKVFQVRKRDTKRIYAMKVLSKKEIVAKKEVAHTIGERKILQRSLESPFLVGLKFSFQTEGELYLVTDFKSGGELFWHLQRETRFTEERARFYIAELILALEHLHKYDIVYRDLKPENILLDATGHVALCDFGLSKADLPADQLTTTFCGTTEYLAPEILLDEHGYSKIVDFWSLGVLLFEMCCGWSPFYAEDTQQMYKNICFGKIRFPKGVICEEGKQFVKGLLNRNPKHRLGAVRDAAELKEHPFFASIDFDLLAKKQVTPPFKPVVESDESTANFDAEFTSADVQELSSHFIGGDELDEEDPSEDWIALGNSGYLSGSHTPNGPLGSERNVDGKGVAPISPMSELGRKKSANGMSRTPSNGRGSSRVGSGTGSRRTSANGNGSAPRPQGIKIKSKKKTEGNGGSPLTNSVQENFRGFTYSGESMVAPAGVLKTRLGDDDEAADGGGSGPTTEDEFEDASKAAGRYASARRKGLGFTGLDDDI